jgi:hypothetical protein
MQTCCCESLRNLTLRLIGKSMARKSITARKTTKTITRIIFMERTTEKTSPQWYITTGSIS